MLKDFSVNLEKSQSYLIIKNLGINSKTNSTITSYQYKDLHLEYHFRLKN